MNVGYLLTTICVTLVGIVGNTLVICAILVHKRLRVLNNMFIVNLAVADLFVSGIIHPFTALGITTPEYFYHNGMDDKPTIFCEFLSSFCVISCCSSIFSIMTIAFNRYIYICHRRYYPFIFNQATVFLMLIGIWMFSLLIDVPNFLGFGRHVFHSKTSTCFFDTVHYGYRIMFTAVSIAFPLAVTCFSYTKIVLLVHKNKLTSNNRIESETTIRNRYQIKPADVKLLRTVAIIGILGIILYTPFSITLLMDDGHIPARIWMFSTGLMHSYSCINWSVYALSNRRFRNAYGHVLKKYCGCSFLKIDTKEIDGVSVIGSSQGDINIRMEETRKIQSRKR